MYYIRKAIYYLLQKRYIGTDISTRALETVAELKRTLPQHLGFFLDFSFLLLLLLFRLSSKP